MIDALLVFSAERNLTPTVVARTFELELLDIHTSRESWDRLRI